MSLGIWNTLRAWLFGEDELSTSLLLDRHGAMINKELAATFTAILISISLSDNILHEGEVEEITAILRDDLALSQEGAEEALSLALESRKSPEEVYPKLRTLALGMADEQKELLIVLALKVADADDRVSLAEESIVEKLAEVLHLAPDRIRTLRKRV